MSKDIVFVWVMPSAMNFACALFTLALLLWQLFTQTKNRREIERARRLFEAFEQGVIAVAAERAANNAIATQADKKP